MTLSRIIKSVGCAGLAVVLSCTVLGCSAFSHRTDAQRQADKATADRVESALDADHQLYAKHIFVGAEDGVVHLTGYVWEARELYEAQQIAQAVPGVSKVVNDLELQRNGLDNGDVTR
jgi:osmotically-inducible protein OsmY